MGSEWVKWEWTPEKPYPETLDTKVHVMFNDGFVDIHGEPSTVEWWTGWNHNSDNWHKDCDESARIVAYYVVERPKPVIDIDVERLINDLKMAIDPLQHPENTRSIIKSILYRLGETV